MQLKWKHQFQFAGFYMAVEKGFYHDIGLDVDIKEIEAGKVAVDELVHQRVHYAVVDPGVLLARAQGAPVKILASIFQHSPLALIVRDEPSIQSITDLKGKRIMMVPGLNADITAALNLSGISSQDFVRQNISFDINDLINGNTDAFSGYITNQPYQLDKLGFGYKIFHPKDQGIDFYGDILITSEKEIREYPNRVKAFKEQSMRGWKYALEHIDETLDVILTNYNSQNFSRRQLKFEALKTKEMISGSVIEIGYMSEHRWRHIADTYIEQGILPKGFSLPDALYKPKTGLWKAIQDNIATFSVTIFTILISLLALHNFSLRRAVRLRTIKLAKSERDFKNLFAGNKCVELIIEPDSGQILDANHAAEQFYGYNRNRLLKTNISDINTLTKEQIIAEMKLAATEYRDNFNLNTSWPTVKFEMLRFILGLLFGKTRKHYTQSYLITP